MSFRGEKAIPLHIVVPPQRVIMTVTNVSICTDNDWDAIGFLNPNHIQIIL